MRIYHMIPQLRGDKGLITNLQTSYNSGILRRRIPEYYEVCELIGNIT